MKFKGAFSAFVISLTIPLVAFAANGTMKGAGTAASPFQIEDYEDLKAIGKGVYLYSSNYVLTKDIDASASKNEMCGENGCKGFVPLGKNKDAADSTDFWGTIDGQNHTISGLNIRRPDENNVAFIARLMGHVTNLKFDGISVMGRDDVACVAAQYYYGVVRKVYVTNGFVQGRIYVGGLVGDGRYSLVINTVSFQGEIKGQRYVGGIAGASSDIVNASADVDIIVTQESAGGIVGRAYFGSEILHVRSSGTIAPGDLGVENVGGIVGEDGYVFVCASTMDLIALPNAGTSVRFKKAVGGIAGKGGIFGNCFYSGIVEGDSVVGGLAGDAEQIVQSFAMGSVYGDYSVGGVAGVNSGVIQTSYAANAVNGTERVGGLVGVNDSLVENSYWNTEISGLDTSAGGMGLSTAKMMKLNSFAGWDTLSYVEYLINDTDTCKYYEYNGFCYEVTGNIANVWTIDEGKSFPYITVNPFLAKGSIPIAVPTSASKWSEKPAIAALMDVDGELVGKWLGWERLNDAKDSIYYGYRIGAVNGNDTAWGTSSYMAVPNKIRISTYAELMKIGNDAAYPLSASYELMADIDASGLPFAPIGDSVHVFSGIFDGKNHKIKNLHIDNPYLGHAGMFGRLYGAFVRNLVLEGVSVKADYNVGALVGSMKNSKIENVVSIDGSVSGNTNVGGLVGFVEWSDVLKVGVTGYVRGMKNVGGITGVFNRSIMRNAYSVNLIKGISRVGGIVGYENRGNEPELLSVYSASVIKAPFNGNGVSVAEGIVGSYPSFTGPRDSIECIFDSSAAGIRKKGRTTEDMLRQSTYEGFDFESVWEIREGASYPYFKGMTPILPGKIVDDGSVNVLAGYGTEISPYKISTYDELKYIGKYEYTTDLCYMLTADIYAVRSWSEDCDDGDLEHCRGFKPIDNFEGVFIGNAKRITDLRINHETEDNVGLFRSLASTAKVSGIILQNATIHGKNNVGAIAGTDSGAILDSIYVIGEITANNNVGGIVGSKTSGSVVRSASKGTVSGSEFVGGIAGLMNKAAASDCYSIASVTGEAEVGGLVGSAMVTIVKNSYAAGDVVGASKMGGLAGVASGATFTSVYYDSLFWGVNKTAAGDLRTTQQMVRPETFKNWDFDGTWKILADTTYPYLAWNGYNIRPDVYIDSSMMHLAGSGTEKDPFLIKTYGDLKSIGFGKYKLSAVYRLANDIDASASNDEILQNGVGYGLKPICKVRSVPSNIVVSSKYAADSSGVFTGKIHGGGHVIKDLRMDYNAKYTALLDSVGESAEIDSLTLTGFTGSSKHIATIAVGSLGLIRNVSVKGSLKSEGSAIGLVYNNYGKIENCSFEGSVRGLESDYKGENAGFVFLNKGLIKNARVDVEVTSLQGGAGAIIQNNEGGRVENVIVNAKMTVDGKYAGGVVSKNYGELAACSASVDIVSKSSHVGGLVGYNRLAKLRNMGVSGRVEGDQYVGGAVGYDYGKDHSISHLRSSVDVTGRQFVGGLIGYGYDFDRDTISYSYATGNVTGTVFDTNMIGLNFADENSIGGFIGGSSYVRIHDCYATGNVKNGSGFVGSTTSVIWNCYAEGDVTNGAGFVGYLFSRGIRNCHASGTVHNGAGFVLDMWGDAEIDKCYATGDVYTEEGLFRGAGFAESNYGSITRSFATGNVYVEGEKLMEQMTSQAGLVAENYGTIDRCYALGNVEGGNSAGALVGVNYKNVTNSYALGKVKRVFSNDTTPIEGLLIGSDGLYYDWYGPAALTSYAVGSFVNNSGDWKELSATEMRKEESFEDFNFKTIWFIEDGVTYPMLRELPNVPFAKNGKLKYEGEHFDKNGVRAELRSLAIIMDTSYATVVELDSAGEALLDSLEKAGKMVTGEFVVDYRVGLLLGRDTLWSDYAQAEIVLEKTVGVVAQVRRGGFNAALNGNHVTLRFGLASAGVAKFSLLDMQGRTVRSFDLGRRDVGTYFETLAVEGIARGRYVGVLQVNGRVTEKTLLIKR